MTSSTQWITLILGLLGLHSEVCGKLLASLDLKPSGFIFFTNETQTLTDYNAFSLYLKLDSVVEEKQHIISVRSESRSEQFIKISLISMQLSVLVNLRHPAVSRWFLVGEQFRPNEAYYIAVEQNNTALAITINNVTQHEQLESVEMFMYPAKVVIGNSQVTPGVNGSIGGVTYNGATLLSSYMRRDEHFKNVMVEMGGEVQIREMEWRTIEERGRRYCPHTAHFPRSEVGTVLRLDCVQNIARAVCGEERIWLVERCNYNKGDAKGREAATKGPKERTGRDDGAFSNDKLIIYIACGGVGVVLLSIIIGMVLYRRRKRGKIHRYKIAKCDQENNFNGDEIPIANMSRVQGISTLPINSKFELPKDLGSNNLDMSCTTLDNFSSDIVDNRIPVFTSTTNPLNKNNISDLYPVYMTSDNNLNQARDDDIISTILGERNNSDYSSDKNYNNMSNNRINLLSSSQPSSQPSSGITDLQWNDM